MKINLKMPIGNRFITNLWTRLHAIKASKLSHKQNQLYFSSADKQNSVIAMGISTKYNSTVFVTLS